MAERSGRGVTMGPDMTVSREVGRLWRPGSSPLAEGPGHGLPDLHLAVELEPAK